MEESNEKLMCLDESMRMEESNEKLMYLDESMKMICLMNKMEI